MSTGTSSSAGDRSGLHLVRAHAEDVGLVVAVRVTKSGDEREALLRRGVGEAEASDESLRSSAGAVTPVTMGGIAAHASCDPEEAGGDDEKARDLDEREEPPADEVRCQSIDDGPT